MQVISIANQKGGVAKTTTAHILATGLTHTKSKVLAVDLDPQTNFSLISGCINQDLTVYDLLTGKATASDVVVTTKAGFDLLPGSARLLGADNYLKGYAHLRKALEPISGNYDYIIIDTPPHLGVLLFNALATSNSIVIPATANILSLQGLTQIIDTVNTVKNASINQGGNPYLTIEGILLTMYSDRTNISKDIKEGLQTQAKALGTKIFKTTIRKAVAIEEIQFSQSDLFIDYPRAKVTDDAKQFIKELTGRKVK